MRELVRKHPGFFWGATLAAVALRLFFIIRFPAVVDDSKIYADIAKNWLQHGVYGISDDGNIVPTYIRLPGYPAFLALIFAIFGPDHFRPVLLAQMLADIGTCLLIADMAQRMISDRAAKAAYLLAALCPFLANYTAAALTETLEIFFTALALDLAIVGLEEMEQRRLLPWFGCGAAVGAAILLRPDGGILLAAIGIYLFFLLVRSLLTRSRARAPSTSLRASAPHFVILAGIILATAALAPLVPWTVRNLRTFHRFEPLAPRYANEEDEFVPRGFNRWVKTWMADYTSVQEIYWPIPGEAMDASKLPARALDSEQQRQQTLDLISQYNQELHISPELDAQFASLAEQRVRAAPLRCYVWLPAVRITDMWLRPRTELLPADPRWWEFNDDVKWSVVAVGFGLINLLYVGAAAAGLVRRRSMASWVGILLVFVALRSLFLGSLENPEPRYTLECYPVVVLLASRVFAK